jgi:hypothetical protein
MPFIAEHRETGARIDITRIDNPRVEIDQEQCISPLDALQQELVDI